MTTPDADEMEQFQRLSDQYQADLPGPLVGEKRPVSDLVAEYAQADQTYVVKTTALARTHASYRSIKGDGQCGWRGAMFGYFEILLSSGDIGLVAREKERLQGFEQTMRAVGVDYDLLVDMFDYTWDLFDAIKDAIQRGEQSEKILMEALNDQGSSNSIVYHFKMMTSSFMKIHSERYAPFMVMPVSEYCNSRIEPSHQEIEHIGLQALNDAVIAPAYIGLEVLYLDRSAGDEVTPHRFVEDSQNWSSIRLIYRPGHYDIIYKDHKPVQVLMQTHTPQYIPAYEENFIRGDMDTINLHSFVFPEANVVASQNLATTSPMSPMNPYSSPYQQAPPMVYEDPALLPRTSYFPTTTMPSMTHQHRQEPPALAIRSQPTPLRSYSSSALPADSQASKWNRSVSPSPPTPASAGSNPKPQEFRIRYSLVCYQQYQHQSLPLDAAAFGNSTQSTAHFAHLQFQPNMWKAEDEYGK
ncbi:hypothetical protein PV08_08191 [Exophiala spinifera]|uniref:ubiquitinyl hydrolase 1 n=1 Tax=Exophiala spinifera TaxID=91928 RepID=A0A0D2BPL2_9EURO|nr:uncharacterized protein PV08_08191 [Exophiala spinifera]KIW13004.1 hypothetical protein PV08_08191 [Exophiala spinifera]